ncbi:hypothetical protein OpiT1DRAFT_00868 [Opitutaceae bacterium TAV1]|nr:hypothetical protein OpiT1DRAFT_00868 [Opitutaceae bacterium TAV1]
MSTDYIPRKDEDFHTWQINFFVELGSGTRITRLGIPQVRITALESLQGQWDDAFRLASQPGTRTPLTIEQKNHARDNYESFLRTLVRQHIANNEQTTDDDRVALGLPIHKTTRTPAPVPATYPDFTVDTGILRQLTIHFHEHGKKTSAKPPGVHGAEILYALLAAPPATLGELTRSGFDTHSPFTLSFDENERGKHVYFCLRWENTRGQKGPWSPIVSAIIP